MNTIKLEIPFNDNNVELVRNLLAKASGASDKAVKNTEVVDAEEVEETAPAKAPAKRASRAKPKAEPVEEDETEEEFELDEEETEDEGVTVEEIKLLMASKVNGDGNRAKIIDKLKKLECKGPATMDAKHYQDFYDFLAKLK